MSPVWKKVLWQAQPHPDNYIPADSFLSSLRRNPNFTPYTYWPLVRSCCPIAQHLSAVLSFLAVFVRLRQRSLDARALVWISVSCFALGCVLWQLLDCAQPTPRRVSRSKAFKSSLLVFLALMGLAPVLRTLSAATSSDSIWALSASLFLLNTLLADHTCIRPGPHSQHSSTARGLTSVLSMNAAMSSSVVLASRLPDDLSVFALVLFAVQLFALFPIVRRRFWPAALQALVTLAACALSLALTLALSRAVAALVAVLYVTVTLVAPAILVWAQRHKNEIRGPWDVAVPRLNCS